MKLKIDETLPVEVPAALRDAGFENETVGDEHLSGAPDAATSGRCEMTLDLARKARRLFEAKRVPPLLLACLYDNYNSVPDALGFVLKAQSLFPRLNCGLASVYLQHLIGTGVVRTGSYCGQLHSFLVIGGNLVVDITADQFGGPSVYVGALTGPWSVHRT